MRLPPAKRIEAALTDRRVFLVMALLILVSKWPVLDQPPVWDSSMSVFPAAITLAHNGLDLAALLREPGYFLGGPTQHSLSLVTWLTALAYRSLGDRPQVVLPVLHLLHFAIGALAMTALWRIGRALLGALPALAVVGAMFLFPPLFVQLGYMYLEMPVLASTALAVEAWIRGKNGKAAIWATMASLVKPTGAIVAGALALASLLSGGPWRSRFSKAGVLLSGPLAAALLTFALKPAGIPGFGRLRTTVIYITSVPDLAVLLVLFLLLSALWRPWRGEGPAARAQLAFASLFVTFFTFFSLLVPLGRSVPILPRYYILIFPFVWLGLAAMLQPRISPRLSAVLLAVLAAFFLTNLSGRLYPNNTINNFAIIERSMAYRDLLELQSRGAEELSARSVEAPVFFDLPLHFKLEYPEMGYKATRPVNGYCLLNQPPYQGGRLEDFPDAFFLLHEYPWLGGEIAGRVAGQAMSDPSRIVQFDQLQAGEFTSGLIGVRTRQRE